VSAKIVGGCHCGQVRYTCDAAPVVAVNCHCTDCQKTSGAPFVSGVIVPVEAIKVEGEVRWFENPADSGHRARRGFCPNCGTQLFTESTSGNPYRGIRAASLDDPSWFKPALDMFTKSAQPWVQMDASLPKFEAGPTRG
jgi:hypothetical protein